MAATISSSLLIPTPVDSPAAEEALNAGRHRRISARAERAMTILAHAIQYLSDEPGPADPPLRVANDRLQTIQLLMSLNRSIYLECPAAQTHRKAPTVAERCRAFFNPRMQ